MRIVQRSIEDNGQRIRNVYNRTMTAYVEMHVLRFVKRGEVALDCPASSTEHAAMNETTTPVRQERQVEATDFNTSQYSSPCFGFDS